MSAGAPVLRVSGAVKRYGERRALDGLDLRLEAGEWAVLLGRNGAGKTTLMAAVAGLARLDAGTVELAGEPAGSPGARRRLGLVPQEIALYPALTGRENLAAFGRMHGLRGGDLARRVERALAWIGLEERAGDRVAGYSGGMKRRLNIACGVLHEPRLVLLDEPAAGVDPAARRQVWEMLAELRDRGAALLQSTHQLEEIQPVCDRVLLMEAGRLVASRDELPARDLRRARVLRLRLDRPPAGLELRNGLRIEGRTIHGTVADAAGELEELLARVRAAGLHVEDLRVEAPGLDELFARLAGSGGTG